ncbi:hypothetical protein IC582_008072 [Cucumis melo]|uniref:Uncharacterized protein LOC103489983 isoform X2 n=1 Tax=Cucumis melo TaxID=3656 RepID=A0A1S3BHR0_CUCME|nr:uncharacterized protein LOC103489983 isoform X2 [Cucumis melo]
MQLLDMKSLRTIFYSRKHFLISSSFSSYKTSPISCRSSLSPNSSLFHYAPRFNTAHLSTDARNGDPLAGSGPENEKRRNVWSLYGSVSSKLTTQRVGSSSDGKEPEQSLGVLNGDGAEDSLNEKTSESVRKVGLDDKLTCKTNSGKLAGLKKKSKVSWVCSDCGHSEGQWWGTCQSCRKVGTMKQFSVGNDSEGGSRTWLPKQVTNVNPMRLTDVNRGINAQDWRLPLPGPFGNEVARVLGGGLVPGSLVLIGGDPGVGKSTLLLQIAAILAEGCGEGGSKSVVYVSGEESVEQIGNRADRLKIQTENLFLYSSTDVEDIFEKIQPLSPRALIIDSIQTVYLQEVAGSAGGITQVKECTSAFLRYAKTTGIPILLIGHVNKSGEVAGPRLLEHIVDVVLYVEGEKCSLHRLLRPVKNRFGSTDELGVFEMLPSGLEVVSNPSEMFRRDHNGNLNSEHLTGLAVAVVMDGTQTFLLEIQALCSSSSSFVTHVNGIQNRRADMIISVLMKQAGLKLQTNAIFINVVSGVTLTETAGDLAIAMAICSSFLEFNIPNDIAFIGEIGLGGELRMVGRMEKRINTVAKLGFKRCVVPKSAENCLGVVGLGKMKLIGCTNLKDVINNVFMVRDEVTTPSMASF